MHIKGNIRISRMISNSNNTISSMKLLNLYGRAAVSLSAQLWDEALLYLHITIESLITKSEEIQ